MTLFNQKSTLLVLLCALSLLTNCGGGGEDDTPRVAEPVNLRVAVSGEGRIVAASGNIRCGSNGDDCTQGYAAVTTETLVATPDIGYYFAGWQTPECAGAAAECTLAITDALDGASDSEFVLNAVFDPILKDIEPTVFSYDHQGRRVTKNLFTTEDLTKTVFIYDVNGNLIQELDSEGNPIKEHIYLENEQVAMADYHTNGEATLLYVHNDHLGTPRMMTNQNAQVVWEHEFTPFGETYALYEQHEINKRFPGQYYDEESGWHYNGQRYYNPQTGRYLQSDPIGLFAGPNTYAYVNNNPLRYSDPEGLCPWCLVGAVLGGGLNVYSQYRNNGGFDNFNWGSFVASTATGALGGGLGTVASRATWRAAGNTWQLSTAGQIAVNGIGNAVIGAGVTAAQNKFTGSCNSISNAALNGLAAGSFGAGVGAAASKGLAALNRSYYNSLPLSTRLMHGSNAISGVGRPVLIPGISTISNATSNTVSNLPIYQNGLNNP